MKVIYIDRTDSTNEEAKRVPFCHGLCIVAREQTGGKGRRGRRWLSKRDKGLYVSFVLERPSRNFGISSLAFGYSTLKALLKFGDGFYLKWPNDVYINGKKIAGVLPELCRDRLVVGIGINLTYSKEELSNFPVPATSLSVEGIEFDRDKLLSLLYGEVVKVHSLLKEGSFSIEEFERYCPMIGREVKVVEEGNSYIGRALKVDTDGALIVETEEGLKKVFAADVSVRER